MIECTELFANAEWATAHLHGADLIRINIQHANHIQSLHVRVSKIASFLEAVRREQIEVKPDRKCLAPDSTAASMDIPGIPSLENG